tara:strand:- start:158 stop:286 length:129 start_codon:yes stop_codon:yes gene_type:complete
MNNIKLTLAEEVKKLLLQQKLGVFSNILISGSLDELNDFFCE